MDQGVYRLLRTLASRTPRPVDEIVRGAGEAKSVLAHLQKTHPAWIETSATGLRASKDGLAALALELVARTRGEDVTDADWLARWQPLASKRGPAKRELDQVYATPASVLRRARALVTDGDVQRGLCFVGDDDLTSLGTALLGLDKPLTVIDIDASLLSLIDESAREASVTVDTVHHDLRDPLPQKLVGRFGCVVTDPPYAIEGFSLFVSRGIELLRPDGRLLVFFGSSRRAQDRALEKERALLEAGLLVEAVIPDFTHYEGAESIGATSTLFVCACTPQTKALVSGRDERESLYTRRSPNAKKK